MIAFDRLTKRYGDLEAVKDLTFSAAAGEIVALLGPNGSGKTTALKAAAGLIRPTSGRVLIDGREASIAEARRNVSYLAQRVTFADSLSGREVVEFYRRLRGVATARGAEVLRMVALNGAGDRPVRTYSGGMLQRLGLAVAAVGSTPILLLDEPTSSLDPEGLQAFYVLAEQRRASGGTVLFSSHQLGDAERLADRFGVIVGGALAAVLTREELMQRLAARGTLRVLVGNEERTFHATAEQRPAILESIRAAGGEIRSIVTEEGRLDDLYAELVRGERT